MATAMATATATATFEAVSMAVAVAAVAMTGGHGRGGRVTTKAAAHIFCNSAIYLSKYVLFFTSETSILR